MREIAIDPQLKLKPVLTTSAMLDWSEFQEGSIHPELPIWDQEVFYIGWTEVSRTGLLRKHVGQRHVQTIEVAPAHPEYEEDIPF